MTLTEIDRKVKKCSKTCKFLFLTMALTWWFGVLCPLGYMDEGKIKWPTTLFWALAGLSLIGLQMVLCNHFDRLRLFYERKRDRILEKHGNISRLPDIRKERTVIHEVRSA